MAEKNDPGGYAELGRIGNDLAARYAKGDKALVEPLYKNIEALAINFLRSRVYGSRLSPSGVPGHLDAEDLLTKVQKRVFRKLDSGTYADKGSFKAFVLMVAERVLLSSLDWKKSATDEEALDDDLKGEIAEPAGKAKNVKYTLNEDIQPDGRIPLDETVDIIRRDLLNLILDGQRSLTNPKEASVFTARAFLGKGEAEIGPLYDMKPDTVTSHFRRASVGILRHVHTHPDFKNISLEGLRQVLEMYLFIEEKDLDLLKEKSHQDVLRVVSKGDISPHELGKKIGLAPAAALKALRAAIVALSQAKTRRAQPVVIPAEGQEAWLWSQVGLMLAAYPQAPIQKRAASPTPGDGELAAFCQVAVSLGYSREDMPAPQTLGDLLGPRVIKDGGPAPAAKAVGIDPQQLMGILSGEVTADSFDSALLAKLAAYFGLDGQAILAAARATASARPGLRTRSLSPEEQARYLESVKRRVLAQKAKV